MSVSEDTPHLKALRRATGARPARSGARGLTLKAARRMASAASYAPNGERLSLVKYRWDVAGNCSNAISREIHVRPSVDPKGNRHMGNQGEFWSTKRVQMRNITVERGKTPLPVNIDLTVRCRKCPQCLRLRQRVWAGRASGEMASAHRTWFGTLTLSPYWHMRALNEARKRLSVSGIDFESLSDGEQFLERHKSTGLWLTLYLKRVRKQSEAALRYLLVTEAHASGLPHYHCLVHETDSVRPVREHVLSHQWSHGFSKFRLVDGKAPAWYVTKYLSKSSLARVRASEDYGTVSNPSVEIPISTETPNDPPLGVN